MKLTGTKKIVGGLALAATVALTGVIGFAQQGQDNGQARQEREGRGGRRGDGDDMDRGPFGGRMAEKLNLTDAQKEQMKQIAARYRATAKQGRGERQGRERNGFDPFKGGTFDEAAVRAAAQARAAAQVEREVARARMMFEMYNVLTPEQKATLAAERQQREQKRQEWKSRRDANSNPSR